MTTAQTTKTKVKERLGSGNIDPDIDDTTLDNIITHESAYIERFTKKQTFSSLDSDLVERIATDLVCARVLEHMAIGMYYGGTNYKIGKLQVDKVTGGKMLRQMAMDYRKEAHKALEILGGAAHFRWSVANP